MADDSSERVLGLAHQGENGFRPSVGSARAGYQGPSRRERATIATGVVAGLLALVYALDRIRDAAPAPRPERALVLFDVPPPPPPPPSVPEPHRVPKRIETTHTALVGGSAGHRRRMPTPVMHDPAPVLLERPVAPVADIDAPPPASGRNAYAGLGTGGLDGVGVGTGSGSGPGDGVGSGSGSASTRYARAIWVVRPDTADFRREWPRAAPRLVKAVHVFLACAVKPNGRPFACRTLIETQPGLGYAAAAIRLAEHSRVRPVLANGQRTDIPVIVPISFLPL